MAASLVLTGCMSRPEYSPKDHLIGIVLSPVADAQEQPWPAGWLVKTPPGQHCIFYPMWPKRGIPLRDELDQKIAVVEVCASLTRVKDTSVAEISGEINYYDGYMNEQSHSISAGRFEIPATSVLLTPGKLVNIELPRGMHYSLELSDRPLL